MEYSFFYDETEHSRKINIQTVTADNYYDNFSTAIIGWKKENEDKIIKQYEAFEEKYTYRKKNGELKSQTMKQKDLKYGFATLNNHTIGFYEDLLSMFNQNTVTYISVFSKVEYVIQQVFRDYHNSFFVDIDCMKYSIIKAILVYYPHKVIEAMYQKPEDFVDELRSFFIERISLNEDNNTIGDIAGISYFTSIVLSGEKIQKSALQKLCDLQNNIRLNLKAAITYYKYMDLIVEKESWLYVTEAGVNFSKNTDFENEFCRLCIDKIIRDGLLDMEAIRYSRVTNTYYIERFGFSVSAALFRNILIQYKALRECSGSLQIDPKYETLFGDLQKKTRMKKSLDKLKLQLEQQERQGELAELFVLEYEKKRITNSTLNEKIKRISIIDVAAGYDIVS